MRACKDCLNFKELGGGQGECRGGLPNTNGGYYGRWPVIARDEWCAVFVPKENSTVTHVAVTSVSVE